MDEWSYEVTMDNPYSFLSPPEKTTESACRVSTWIRKLRVLFIGGGAFMGLLAGVPFLTRENALGFLSVFPGAILGGLAVRWLASLWTIKKEVSVVAIPWRILAAHGCLVFGALFVATVSKGYAIVMVFVIITLSIVAGFYAAGSDPKSETA